MKHLNFYLAGQLIKRNFIAKKRQSYLGFLWPVVMPLLVIISVVFLNKSGVISPDTGSYPYPLFVLCGILFWQLFASCLISGTNSIVADADLVSKAYFAKESLVISSVAQPLFDFAIMCALTAAAFVFYGFLPGQSAVLLPFLILPIVIFACALSFLLALLNAIFRDVSVITGIAVSFLFFLSPVLYPMPTSGPLFEFNRYNFLAYLINAPRELLLSGSLNNPLKYTVVCIFSVIFFLISRQIFLKTEPLLAERI